MRTSFAPLDDTLIEWLFQPAADLVHCRAGVGREAAACFCVDIASLAWITSRAPGLSSAVTTWDASTAFADLALLLLGMIALVSLRRLFRRSTANRANPLRAAMRPHRAVVLLMLAADLVQLRTPGLHTPGLHTLGLANAADLAMLVFAAAALYLAACRERPPPRRGWPALARMPAG